MFTTQKKKSPWSRSFFGSRALNKVFILKDPRNARDSTNSYDSIRETSLDGLSNAATRPRPSPMAKLRRSGSKVRSILSKRQSNDSRAGNSFSSSLSERDIALAIVRDAAAPMVLSESRVNSHTCLPRLQIPSGHEPNASALPEDQASRPLKFTQKPTDIPTATSEQVGDIPLAQIVPLEVFSNRKDRSGLRHSRSMPGLAHQLSHKLSNTFGNPTIVHRPSLRSRPSLSSICEGPLGGITSINAVRSPVVDTDPSSYYNSDSASPVSRSTGKTSLESNVASLGSLKTKDRFEKAATQINLCAAKEEESKAKPLEPIPETPVEIKPTMLTVETTANAKIFFETHFNSILSGQATPRSLRRHQLESLLHSEPMTADQRHLERCVWAKQENEHLRQSWVLKGKSRLMAPNAGVSVAGYEVVRILGKGSFGVVRLVRQMSEGGDETIRRKPIRKTSARDELNALRMTAIDTIRSTFEGQKAFPGRNSSKFRKDVYAMKVIRKSDMIRNSQESHLRAERDFLVASENSRWVVPLIASFQDNTNLYLVMEYMIGGDFLGLLIRKERLKEKVTRWYIAEMILCIEETHRLRWIHRDIKPDNFLISASGHLKISDFGLAFDGHWSHDQGYFNNHRYSLMDKLGINVEGDSTDRNDKIKAASGKKLASFLLGGKQRNGKNRHERPLIDQLTKTEGLLQWRNRQGKRKLAASVVGTSQYMAPEVIRGDLYDGRCDWWSIGIIIYECLYGCTPFVDDDRAKTKLRILNHSKELEFPSTADFPKRFRVSREARDLICRILQEKEHRLCSQKYKLNDYEEAKGTPVHHMFSRTFNKEPQDYRGHFVYPDDATDLKSHPFFQDISWDDLHLSRPPEVPNVKSREDTVYFDEEEPISDVDDAPSLVSSVPEDELLAQEALEEAIAAAYMKELDKVEKAGDFEGLPGIEDAILAEKMKVEGLQGKKGGNEKEKEKKRPRDRILRDKRVRRQVLEVRKRGAFMGYTYRRPRSVAVGLGVGVGNEGEMRRSGWEGLGWRRVSGVGAV